MKRFLMSTTLAAVLLMPSLAAAQDFDAGSAAYGAGDYAAAMREWRPLAEQGDAGAQSNLGLMYSNGQGVPQDKVEAVRWYRLAAEKGDAVAQNNLGFMYANSQGVPQDSAEAVRWWRLAAEQGNANAQSNLGSAYANGQGVPQDFATAHMWHNIGAANGSDFSAETRDELAARMTPSDISEAQRRARVCMESGYQDCN